MVRGCLRVDDIAFISLQSPKISWNEPIVVIFIFRDKSFSSDWVWKKVLEYLLRRSFLDCVIDISFDFKPTFFQQARPHVYASHRLGEKWIFFLTQSIVINVNVFFPNSYIHSQYTQTIWVCVCENNLMQQMWVVCQKAEYDSKWLHNFISDDYLRGFAVSIIDYFILSGFPLGIVWRIVNKNMGSLKSAIQRSFFSRKRSKNNRFSSHSGVFI